jgi:hypothetical protein
MTVAELIAQLQRYPADMQVYRADHEFTVWVTEYLEPQEAWVEKFASTWYEHTAHPAGVIIR